MAQPIDMRSFFEARFRDIVTTGAPDMLHLVDYIVRNLTNSGVPLNVGEHLVDALHSVFKDREVVIFGQERIERLGVVADTDAADRLVRHMLRPNSGDKAFDVALIVFLTKVFQGNPDSAAVERNKVVLIDLFTTVYAMLDDCRFDPRVQSRDQIEQPPQAILVPANA